MKKSANGKSSHFQGLMAASFTPMDGKGKINPRVIGPYANLMARNGINGIFVNGTTGESLSLTTAERKELAECWVDQAPKDLKIMVHVGHNSLEESKELARHAGSIKADSISSMAPSFFKPRGIAPLVEYLEEVAREAPGLPFYYYHLPAFNGVDCDMAEFVRQAGKSIPNFAGAKFTSYDLMQYRLAMMVEPGRFDLLYGHDELLLCALAMGAKGAVGSTYNLIAPLYVKLIAAFKAGDLGQALALQDASIRMIDILLHTGNLHLTALAKNAMKFIGLDLGQGRPPLGKVNSKQLASLEKALKSVGFYEYCCS